MAIVTVGVDELEAPELVITSIAVANDHWRAIGAAEIRQNLRCDFQRREENWGHFPITGRVISPGWLLLPLPKSERCFQRLASTCSLIGRRVTKAPRRMDNSQRIRYSYVVYL